MKFKILIRDLEKPALLRPRDFTLRGISCDSKGVKKDFVFIAIKGTQVDGHQFVREAIKKGARAVIVEDHFPVGEIAKNCTVVKVADTRQALVKLASRFYGYPARKLRITGVTGTNGKTTIAYLIENLIEEMGSAAGVISTINYRFRHKVIAAHNTTPGALELQSLFARMQKAGSRYIVMEVSSHALEQGRVEGINFSQAIFTNLTQDHLDYHHNMEAYFQAKAKLFRSMGSGSVSIINIDDAYGRRLLRVAKNKIITYGIDRKADISGGEIRFDIKGTSFLASTPKYRIPIKTVLIGRYNVYNILACIAWGFANRIEAKIIGRAIEKFQITPGRLERVECGQDFSLFVDYAHTDDALKNVLITLRELRPPGKIIVVFGCGGNRDKAKRPKMGRVVSQLADFAIVTSDNPRNEQPAEIIRAIAAGIKNKNYQVIIDRKQAISAAVKMARQGDIILLAGKGHEDYQIFKENILHFDDREVARECLMSLN